MKKTTIITLVSVAALLVLAGFTVLNRAWWVRRINARWTMVRIAPPTEEEIAMGISTTGTPEVQKFDAARAQGYGYFELARLYFQGQDWWTRTTPATA